MEITRDNAWQTLTEYTKRPALLRHAQRVQVELDGVQRIADLMRQARDQAAEVMGAFLCLAIDRCLQRRCACEHLIESPTG